jgi:hypothetical protein
MPLINSVESPQSVTETTPSATSAKSQEKSGDEFSRRYGISKKHMKVEGLWVQEIGDFLIKCPDLSNRGNENLTLTSQLFSSSAGTHCFEPIMRLWTSID